MNVNENDVYRTPVWYPSLANYTFPTTFVKLQPEEIKELAEGNDKGDTVKQVIDRLQMPMRNISGNKFVFTDLAAPTDTSRFAGKRGAVYSPRSAWRFLAESEKIRAAAKSGKVEFICIRPFRRITRMREFRLFIYEGELSAMSQYWLTRHYHRLERNKDGFWKKAGKFVKEISWALPVKTLVIDIYFTADNDILIIDLNPWGEPTDSLLLHGWDQDWAEGPGMKTIPPPYKISGEVNVSF